MLIANRKKNGGFTFVELIIVVVIVITLASVTIGGFNDYQSKVVLSNLAQDMALSIRLAQSYGLNVRGQGTDDFDISYGVHFTSGNDTEYYLFRDLNRAQGGYLDTGDRPETFTLNGGYNISNLCATEVGGLTVNCFSGGDAQITDMHIAFDRPKPDARFRDNTGSTNYQQVDITISGPENALETITVFLTGYISVQ